MSDDDTLEGLLEEALDDDLFEPEDSEEEALDEDLFESDEDESGAVDEPFSDEDDDADEVDDATPAEATVPLDASEDGDDELEGEPAVDLAAIEGIEGIDVDDPLAVAGEVEGDVDDRIREGEFVCSSCHMAKRPSALADADELLCRDCV